MGSATEAASFKRSQQIPFSLLSNTDQRVYNAYGLGDINLSQEMQTNSLGALFRETLRGNFAGMPVGSVTQLGGTFLIDREGTARYVRRDRSTSDYPRRQELLEIVKKALA